MNEMLHSLSFASASAAGALFSAIWEGSVLAIAVYLCLRLLPGLSAAARSVVWLNVFVLLVLLHFVPAFTGRSADPTGGRMPALHLDPRWSLGVVTVWLALSLWRAGQLVAGILHLRRLAGRAAPVAVDGDLQALLADGPGGRAAELCTSEEVARPSVLGFFRPRVLVPPALVEALTPHELQQVVLHEMEHLRRGDDWTNLLQKIGLVLFPLNPVLLWVERRLCAERELACDDRVVRSSAGRKSYALCLTRLAEFSILRRSFSLVLGLWSRRPELVRRVHRILRQPVQSMGRRPAIAATGSVLAGALGCAVALSHSPQFVSFLPAHPPVLQAQSLDPHEVARSLGGTPQLMKATMPARTVEPSGHQQSLSQPMRRAVLKAVHRSRPAGSRMATLNPVPAPLPILERHELIVLTEITTFSAPPRAVLAVSRDRRTAPARAVPATFAIVPVPNGWLIIQI
jgi:Zn-dependent protease with chaperone function